MAVQAHDEDQLREETIGQLVARNPGLSRVFEELRIDFCCGGGRTVEAVCAERGLDVDAVVARLRDASAERGADPDCVAMTLSALCDHIEHVHHAYLRAELPRLSLWTDKVARVHGDRHPPLVDVRDVFARLREEMEHHMMKEEQILFPAIRRLDQEESMPQLAFGSIASPIHCMVREHENAGSALAQLRVLCDDYVPPHDACNTYRAMFHSLSELERDMHTHVHKENYILFPRAVERESQLGGAK
ncbi:MAG: iron-sulfur cluster repair di-iron protein [Planctomycetes bacterium]|nr:iron-sulfur cluster repair di-iron protein [Planctomycetota bacterium]